MLGLLGKEEKPLGGGYLLRGARAGWKTIFSFYKNSFLKIYQQQLESTPSWLLWDHRMETSPPHYWLKEGKDRSSKKHRAGAFALCSHCGPATPTFPWGARLFSDIPGKGMIGRTVQYPTPMEPLSFFPGSGWCCCSCLSLLFSCCCVVCCVLWGLTWC